MALPNYYFPYFSPPPPAVKPPPSHPVPPPPTPPTKPPPHPTPPTSPTKPPTHPTLPPPHPTPVPPHPTPAKPPSHSTPPPPPHKPFHPPPPHVHPPPALPPHVGPHPPPLPPSPSPNHPTIIIIVVISCGSVFLLAFLAVALCCFLKKKRKRAMQETEVIHFDEHRKIKEAIVEGPHGPQAVFLSVEDDVHIDEAIRKDETNENRWKPFHPSSSKGQEIEVLHVDGHEKVKEEIVEGPNGSKTVVLTVEDDVHVDELIRKNGRSGEDGHHHH